jgi:DNA mismatch repair ATPase MutL
MTDKLNIPGPSVKYLPIADRRKMLADVVILDWSSVIEELVLNAVDAGANNLKIW